MDTQTISIPRLGYTFAEAEVATGLSRSTLYRAVARGDLKRVKVGKRAIIPADDLAELCGAKETAGD